MPPVLVMASGYSRWMLSVDDPCRGTPRTWCSARGGCCSSSAVSPGGPAHLVTLAAIAFGATAVIFAFGLRASLDRAAASQSLSATVPVQIQQNGPGGGPNQVPTAQQDAAVTAALNNYPATAHQTTVYENQVKVPGLAGSANAWAFSGGSSWLGYGIIAGHWYDAPGQVDVNTAFLTDSGLAIGDTATINTGTAQVTVHIVGQVFHPSSDPTVFGSTQTLPGLATPANVLYWDVGLRPGTSTAGYVQAVNRTLGVSGMHWRQMQKNYRCVFLA